VDGGCAECRGDLIKGVIIFGAVYCWVISNKNDS
jgi:hypothetical protein